MKSIALMVFAMLGVVMPMPGQGNRGGTGLDRPGGWTPILLRDALSPGQAAALERTIADYEAARSARRTASGPQRYRFLPHAGNLWKDLPAPNYLDLDPTAGLLDWDCSQYTYDGHTGMDTPIVSFKAQNIGVPVFAALDGVVVDAHDGEPDTNTSGAGNPRANYVVLDHGGMQYSYYYHFKRNSIAVSIGETVAAGRQIGLTGSSGYSTWPHLHFATRFNGRPFEPYAGACRTGASGWAEQEPLRRDPYVFDFCFSASGFEGDRGLPWDTAVRTGTVLSGNRTIHLQIEGANLPARAAARFQFMRPDGSAAAEFDSAGTGSFMSFFAANFSFSVDFDRTGPWRLLVEVDGHPIADAPFTVVSSTAEIVNRAPHPVRLKFDPSTPEADEVLFCRVGGALYGRDPDYDLVAYHYRWTVNGAVVREVTTAGMADALQRDFVRDGDRIECAVTPSDGSASGPATAVQATVGRSHARPLDPPAPEGRRRHP